MPHYTTTLDLPRPPAAVFALFAQPAQVVRLAPPELHLELVEGPARVSLGSVLRWKARRWGISQRLVGEVTTFEEATVLAETQREGPFAVWVLTRRFEATADGTRLHETVDFEPPRGMLGRLVTADVVRTEVEKLFAFRAEKLRELLG